MATTPCDLSGWLTKRGALRKNWLRRWFELRGAELQYYESQTAARQGAKPKGSISLRDCCDVRRSTIPGASELEMELECVQRTFRVQAIDGAAFAEWLRALQSVQQTVAGKPVPGRRSYKGSWVEEGTAAAAPPAYNPGALGVVAVASAPPADQVRVAAAKCPEGVPLAGVDPGWEGVQSPPEYVVHAIAVNSAGHELAEGGSSGGDGARTTDSAIEASINALNRVRVRWSLRSHATPSDSDYIGICEASSPLDDYATYEYNGAGQRSGELDIVYEGIGGSAYVARYYSADGAVHAQSAAFVFPHRSAETASAAAVSNRRDAPALEVVSVGRDGQLCVRFGLQTASTQSDYIAVHTAEGVGAYDYVPEGQTCGMINLDLTGMDLIHGLPVRDGKPDQSATVRYYDGATDRVIAEVPCASTATSSQTVAADPTTAAATTDLLSFSPRTMAGLSLHARDTAAATITTDATTPTASLRILSSQLERWHESMVTVAWRTHGGYVASEDDVISLCHTTSGVEVASAPLAGAWQPPAQEVGIAGETELLLYFEDDDEEAAALHTGIFYRLSFQRGGQTVIGHSEAFQWVDPAIVASGRSDDSGGSEIHDSDSTSDDDPDDDSDEAVAHALLTHPATRPALAYPAGGTTAVGGLRVGSAVQVTPDRAVLLVALQEIDWPIHGREDSLGQVAIVTSVTHSSTQDRVAILEMCNGRNADVLAMPKAALVEVAAERLGPVPAGWTQTAEGLWRHQFTGCTRELRPVHRAEDPAALRKEFAERDVREERARRQREKKDAAAKKAAKAASKAKQSSGVPTDGARLCRSCALGRGKDECCVCGKWAPSNTCGARLCTSCGFGRGKDECVKCGNWAPSGWEPAILCNDCSFGSGKDTCAKCRDRRL